MNDIIGKVKILGLNESGWLNVWRLAGLQEFGYPRFFRKQRVIALDWRKRVELK